MKVVALLVLVVCSLCRVSAESKVWAQEPTGYRDIHWNSLREETRTRLNLRCYDNFNGCIGEHKIAGVEVTNGLFFSEKQEFKEVQIAFPSSQFELFKSVFEEKYGLPTTTNNEKVQNNMGAEYLNENLEWVGDTAFISLSKYGETVTEGAVIIGLREWIELQKKKTKEKAKKATDDF